MFFQVTLSSILAVIFILWLITKFDNSEKKQKTALKEFDDAYKDYLKFLQDETDRLTQLQQKQKLLAEMEQIKDDLPKEIEIKIGDQ